ncbi:type II toxin-antitoxin system VapC family toxin [Thermus sp.]|uniref:type II toxin-antitoxin system VapC family toxin n=1 Tax=Thermus sp. TaxID=275 RepID=UPI00307DDF7D
MEEAWDLRERVSAYDAHYVALARRLSAPLLTADGPLARIPGLGVPLLHLRL